MLNSPDTLNPLGAFLAHGLDSQSLGKTCGWLEIAPLALVVVAPWKIYHSIQKSVCVRKKMDNMLIAKISTNMLLLSMQLYHLFLSYSRREAQLWLALETAMFAEALCCMALFYTEHRHEPRPSAFLSIYLAISLLTRASLAWLDSDICCRNSSGLAIKWEVFLKGLLLCFHETCKRAELQAWASNACSPEACYGWWMRKTGLWIFPSIRQARGAKSKLDIVALPGDLPTRHLIESFEAAWEIRRTKSYPLVKAYIDAQKLLILQTAFFTAAYSASRIGIVYFFFHFMQFLDNAQTTQGEDTRLRSAKAAAFVVAGISLCISVANFVACSSIDASKLRLRAMLTGAIFRHTYRLSDSDASKSASLSLITSDIDTVSGGLDVLFELLVYVIHVVICSCFLWSFLGFGTLAVLTLCLGIIILGIFVLQQSGSYSKQSTEKTAARQSSTQDMMSNMKNIRLTSNVAAIRHVVTQLRNIELEAVDMYGWGWSIPKGIVATSFELMPTSVFFTALGSEEMGGSPTLITCFIILGYLGMAVRDFHTLPKKILQLHQSMQRIEAHLLLQPEVQQVRDHPNRIPRIMRPIVVNGPLPRAKAVEFSSAYVAPSPTAFPVLRDVSLSLARGTLTVITGNVGSGKTTFLRALIDRCTVSSGTVEVDDDAIAYCGQHAWVQNATIKQNIVGPAIYNDLWYRQVVHRCALAEDILRFPNRDDEVVGQQGYKLTDSQRHRLALARAVYSRPTLLILDDIFSSQSAGHAECVVARLFAPQGLLRSGGTVVVAARNYDALARHANAVLEIDDTGGVEKRRIGSDFDDYEADESVRQVDQDSTCADMDRLAKFSSEVSAQFSTQSPFPQVNNRRSYSSLLRRVNRGATWLCLVIAAGFAVAESIPSISLWAWFPIYTTPSFPYMACISITLVGEAIFICTTKFFQNKVTRPIQAELHEQLVEAVLTAPMEAMTPTNIAEASNLLSQGVQIIDTTLFISIFAFIYSVMYQTVFLVMISSTHLLFLVHIPLSVILTYFLHKATYSLLRDIMSAEETISQRLCASFSEAISGVAHIRTFQWQNYHWQRSKEIIDQTQKIYSYSLGLSRVQFLAIDLILGCLLTISVVIAARYDCATHEVGISLFLITCMRTSIRDARSGLASLKICTEVLERSDKLTEELQATDAPFQTVLPQRWPGQGRVEFRDVAIRPAYPASLNLTVRRVSIPSRADAGIAGNPFTGKTALLMAMQGMIPYDGSITIDGIEAREIPPDKIREAFTVIPQSPIIIRNGSIRQNLILHETLLDQVRKDQDFYTDVHTILVNMGLSSVIQQCGGLDAQFSKLRLTQAQMQRFAMAQGLMKFYFKETRFVLNDSALSTVDSETLSRMTDVCKRSFRYAGATVIQTASHLPALQEGSWLATINADGLVREATWFNNNQSQQSLANVVNSQGAN